MKNMITVTGDLENTEKKLHIAPLYIKIVCFK